MKTLEDLKRIREQALQSLTVREGENDCKIVVAMGTCGIASGAREVMSAILDELGKRGINDVTVTQSGCKGLCDREPTVDVIIKGQSPVTYCFVTPEKARVIIEQHVINGQVQGEWVITPPSR